MDLISKLQTTYDLDIIKVRGDQFCISSEWRDGKWLLDFWNDDNNTYNFGVHNELENVIKQHGYYAEWTNPSLVTITKEL